MIVAEPSREVMVGDRLYQVIQNPDGTHSLKRYNDKHGMWVTINFLNVPEEEARAIEKAVVDLLAGEYKEKATGKQ